MQSYHSASGKTNTKLQVKLSLSFRWSYKIALGGAISKLHAKIEVSLLWSYEKVSCEARS